MFKSWAMLLISFDRRGLSEFSKFGQALLVRLSKCVHGILSEFLTRTGPRTGSEVKRPFEFSIESSYFLLSANAIAAANEGFNEISQYLLGIRKFETIGNRSNRLNQR